MRQTKLNKGEKIKVYELIEGFKLWDRDYVKAEYVRQHYFAIPEGCSVPRDYVKINGELKEVELRKARNTPDRSEYVLVN